MKRSRFSFALPEKLFVPKPLQGKGSSKPPQSEFTCSKVTIETLEQKKIAENLDFAENVILLEDAQKHVLVGVLM